MRVGDRVLYYDEEYTVEKDYGNGVFFIGNEVEFCDLVPESHLTLVEQAA